MKRGLLYRHYYSMLILVFIFGFSSLVFFVADFEPSLTGFAVADCLDSDGDGYYNEACTTEDLGCGTATKLVALSYDNANLDFDGTYVTYSNEESGNWDVYYSDLSGTILPISTDGNSDINPSIYESDIVYQSYSSDNWNIVLFGIDIGNQDITTDTSDETSPDLNENYIVFERDTGTDHDIYYYDRNTQTEDVLVSGTGDQISPSIDSTGLVAYASNEDGDYEIYTITIDGTATQITDNSNKDIAPNIDDNIIVWQTNNGANWDVYAYTSGSIINVAIGDHNERNPSINDGVVTWMDDRTGDYNIYSYDISSGETTQITSEETDETTPVIIRDSIAWLDYRSGNDDIYYALISDCTGLTGDCDDSDDTSYPTAKEICSDEIDNDCNDEADDSCDADLTEDEEETTTSSSCLIDDIEYNPWGDESFTNTNSANDSDLVYTVILGDGTCETETITSYIYSTYTDDGVRYYTDSLVETLSGIMTYSEADGYDVGYADWTVSWPGTDTYFYFIGEVNGDLVLGDTLLVCEDGTSCPGESITITDASDYIGEDEEEETVVEEEEEEEIDCPSLWDCSNVDWSDCSDSVTTRDLNDCQGQPNTSDEIECWDDEYLPESEKECLEESTDTESEEEDETEEETESEDVPFWSNVSLVILLGLLVGYYWKKQ
jgi:TolB protein